jgi:intein-encoded DNA endonuclease-like protein
MVKIKKENLEADVSNGLTYKELCSKYKITHTTLKRKFKKLGVEIEPKRTFNPKRKGLEDEQSVIEKYQNGERITNIRKICQISSKTIKYILNKNGIPIKDKYDRRGRKSLDIDYFCKIDTEEKAYFLGLLYTDGYLDEKNGRIEIGLHNKDLYILEAFEKAVKSERSIRKLKKKDFSILTLCSRKMTNDLKNLGLFQRKSLTLKFPSYDFVPKNLMPHFIRGAFDGDGCVSVIKIKNRETFRAGVNFVGSEFFINGISNYLKEEMGIFANVRKVQHSNGAFFLQFSRVDSLKTFYKHIYPNPEIFFKRKKEKFEDFFFVKKNLESF